ncbi:GLN1, partial [Symbiodinium necroappetens]
MAEKKVDPATGEAYTLKELMAHYKGTYKKKELEEYFDNHCRPVKVRQSKAKAKPTKDAKPEPKAKAKAKATAKAKSAPAKPKEAPKEEAEPKGLRTGKDGGASALAKLRSFSRCVLAEYVWLDADGVTRSKTMTMTARPIKVTDLKVWNYDGSSTGQADGHNSEVLLKPRAIFNDPFRGYPHVMVLADAWQAWDDQPAKNNTRATCAETMQMYKSLDPWFGIEQEYTLMKPGRVGEKAKTPLGFNKDDSEPAPQGPYYTGAGYNVAIGRPVADEHYKMCMEAGVKISGINAEVMPGQWEFQVGPCRGIEMGDHLTMARYIMLRVTEKHDCVCSFDPKPKEGDWNGAGCHTNFSVTPMRILPGGYDTIIKVCEAFGKVAKEHIAEYGEGNDKRLTGKHETCDINTFKYGVANRGASIRIPRDAEKAGRGYMEDRRPAANCDPYRVTNIIMKTTGECLNAEIVEAGAKMHTAFVFIKPHAVTDKVKTLVKDKLTEGGLTIKSEGAIKAEVIDKKKLIDIHYGAIAAK